MTELHVLRVFLGPDGRGGNPLGVVLDGGAIAADRRQQVAADLGFSETVFVEAIDAAAGTATVRIFTPGTELAFAGHPTVGTAWLLAETGSAVGTLRCPAGDVLAWTDAGRRGVRARASWVHPIDVIQLPDAAAVDAETPGALGDPGRYVWAWEDEVAGRLRSRYFATDVGIVEDEATGAAAVVMGDRLGRDLVIRQGVGSEILVRLDPTDGTVAIGGRVEAVERRAFADPGAGA
jgi:predicted PhzF superfamily epimerase YddE/YHI9